MSTMTNPWDRQPFEDDDAFAWWTAYRDTTPPRRLDKVRRPATVKPPLQRLLDLYHAGHWQERAAAWDQHLDTLRQQEREAAVREETKHGAAQDAQHISDAREILRLELDKLLATVRECEASALPPNTLIKLADTVIKLGRLTRGESTDNVRDTLDLSGLSLDDLRKLREIKERASHGKA